MAIEEYTADSWPADRWPNFSFAEMRCSHTRICRLDPSFMDRLQGLRSLLKKAMVITSGYRAPSHPVEAGKPHPGTHSEGRAVDIRCGSGDAWKIVTAAGGLGFTGIGVSQSSQTARFVHLDDIDKTAWSRPAMWSY
jgi:zinc D-Ala-D-Ala carboxypeptidase